MKPIVIFSLFACLLLFSCKNDYTCNCTVYIDEDDSSFENNQLYESTTEAKASESCDEKQTYLGRIGNGAYAQCELKKL